MLIAICALVPLLGGALSALISFKTARARNIYIFIITLATSILALLCAWALEVGELTLFRLSSAFECCVGLDGAGKLFVTLVAALWPPAALYAFEYIEHEERIGNFFVFYTMAYGVTLLLASARNLFTLYIFYEFLTIVTLPLVEHGQNKEAYRAGRTYLLYLIGGASLGFAAMVIVSALSVGDTSFAIGGLSLSMNKPALAQAAFALAFVGFGVKAAIFPLCRWLPKASVAPTPVTALLHAVAVVNAGAYSVMRVSYYVFPREAIVGSLAQYIPMLLSAATVLYGALRALRENHLKRRLAWSTVSNLGYMLFAFSLLNNEGLLAGLNHMVFHSLMKIILFFCAGAIMVKTGRTDVHELRGIAKKMPYTMFMFTLAGAALTGVPPLCGFTSKYLIVTAALNNHSWAEIIGAVCLIGSAICTAFYIFTVAVPAYFAPENGEMEGQDMGLRMKMAVGVVVIMMLTVSALSSQIYSFIAGLLGVI